MKNIDLLKQSINKTGIKEVARRARLSPSTVSRINSGQISPSLEVAERISHAVGLHFQLLPDSKNPSAPRLIFARDVLGRLRKELRSLGVRHVVIFGSVARQEDRQESDIDIFLDFGKDKPTTAKLLKAEGKVIEAFGTTKVDLISQLDSSKGQKLKTQIEKDGVSVF